jgi:hypothetical protein
MASDGNTVDRLREYLRELSPHARSLLIRGLERALVHGDEIEGGDLILNELRRVLREGRAAAPRYGNSARLFFKPLEPFLIDDSPEQPHPGRIVCAALEPLWTWIRRDLLAEETKAYTDEVAAALAANNALNAEFLAYGF